MVRITIAILRDLTRDPQRAAVIAKILKAYYRRIRREEGPDEVTNWLDNDVVGFWSPSYRNALNDAGKAIFDRVADQISDPLAAGADIDGIVTFLSEVPLPELLAFATAAMRQQPDTNVYALGLRAGHKSFLNVTTQQGGANDDDSVHVYAHGLASKSRVQILHAILEQCSNARRLAAAIHRVLGVSPALFDYAPEAKNMPYVAKMFRHLLRCPLAHLRKIRETLSTNQKKKTKV